MVTFFHDHMFLKYENNYYTTGSLNRDVIDRYIESFGIVKFVTRQTKVDSIPNNSKPSNSENTLFIAVPDYKKITKVFNYFKAKRIIKKEVLNADYIILRTSSVSNVAAKYAKKYNKPYLVEVVGCAWDSNWNYSLLGKLIAPISFFMQKKTVKNADYAVYVTNEYLQNKYPNQRKTTNVSNVSLKGFDDCILEKRLRKINNSKNDKIILGTAAAVDVVYKGQKYIIETLGRLKKEGITNYEYQLIGGGDQSFLKSVAKKHDVVEQVNFLGTLSHDEVFKWLDTIDIYSQPSRQEGLPRALIEAMSRGLPAFGAKTAGIPELLDTEFIFSNTKNNINEICEILRRFDKEKMVEQAKTNYEEARKYDAKIIEKRRKDFFKDFISNY